MTQTALQKKYKSEAAIFIDAMAEAHKAAEAAGDKWVAENTKPRFALQQADLAGNRFGPIDYILDVCGFAYINFRDKRSRFYKMAREWELGDKDYTGKEWYKKTEYKQYNFLHIRTKHSVRQEMGLAEACMKAACEAINKYYPGEVYMTSRID